MKRVLLLATALILSASMYAQTFQFNKFEEIDGMAGVYTNAVMESDDGSLFMAVRLGNGYHRVDRIMEMTKDGEIIESKYIEVESNADCAGFFPFFRHPKQNATNVFVYFNHGIPTTFNAILFDNNLNVRKNIRTRLPYSDRNGRDLVFPGTESCILDSENNIVIIKRIDESKNFACIKLDLDGNIILEKEITIDADFVDRSDIYYALTVYNEKPLQYAYSFINNNSLSRIGIAVLDSEFNIIDENHCIAWNFDGHELRTNVAGYDKDSYLISTQHTNFGYGISESINLRKMDKSHNIINEYKHEFQRYVENGSILYNPKPYIFEKNILVDKDGGIYWIYLMPRQDNIGNHDLYISYFDSDLNLIWERKVQDHVSKHSSIMSATICDNGDLALTGLGYDNDFNNLIFTMVMDKDGKPLNIEESLVLPYSFYPNPADDAISLRFSPDVNCEKVEIYSLDGKLCHAQNFNFNTIDINTLSSGIYMMKVTLDNGNTYTEKVVVR